MQPGKIILLCRLMADLTTQQATAWTIVQTDAGPVTLASVEALQARAVQLRDWVAKAAASAQSLRTKADEQLAAGGSTLLARATDWAIPADLQLTTQHAKALTEQVAADDQRAAALKGDESTAGVLGRIGVKHHEHQVEQDRSQAATQLHGLLVSIARSAPSGTFPEADQVDAQIVSAQASAKACDDEVVHRQEAIKAM